MSDSRLTDRIEVEAHTRNLAVVREFLHGAIKRSVLPKRDVNKLVLAVDEAVANTIEHGYGGHTGNVEIVIDADDARFLIRVRDTGAGYDVAEKSRESATLDLAEHIAAGNRKGLGLFILGRVMDEVHYTSKSGEANELTLIKYIRTGEAGK